MKIDLAALRQLRAEKEVPYWRIVEKTEELGCAVSLSTVRRVFAADCKIHFRYNTTIRPIYAAILECSKPDKIDQIISAFEAQDSTPPKSEFDALSIVSGIMQALVRELNISPSEFAASS